MEYKLQDGKYIVANFDQVVEQVKKYLLENAHTEMVIADESDFKLNKKERTEIRKKLEEVKNLRKELNEAALGTFNTQCKEIEKLINDADTILKQKVDAYNESIGKGKVPTYVITIKTGNKKKFDSLLKKLEKEQEISITSEVK